MISLGCAHAAPGVGCGNADPAWQRMGLCRETRNSRHAARQLGVNFERQALALTVHLELEHLARRGADQGCILAIECERGRRHALADRCRAGALLVIAEHAGQHDREPHSRARREGFGNAGIIGQRRVRARFQQPHTGIAALERAADLGLELVNRLHRVPARRPEERQQCRRHFAVIAFHGGAEWRIRAHRRLRLPHVAVRVHCRAAGEAVRLAGDPATRDAECLRRCRAWKCREAWQRIGQSGKDIVLRVPAVAGVAAGGAAGIAEPAPGFADIVLGEDRLVEALRPPLAAHQRAAGLGEARRRQHEFGALRGRALAMIEHHQARGGECCVDRIIPRAAGEVVLQHDHERGRLGQRRLEAALAVCHQRQAEAVAFGNIQHQRDGLAARTQCGGDVGGGLDHAFLARLDAGDDQRAFGRQQRLCDCVRLRGKIGGQIGNRGRGGIDGGGNRETEPRDIGGGGAQGGVRDVVEPGCCRCHDKERAAHVARECAHTGILPMRNVHLGGSANAGAAYRLAQREGGARCGVGQVRAEHQGRIRLFHFAERGDMHRAGAQNIGDQTQQAALARADAGAKILRPDQGAQGEIGFQRGAR